MKDTEYYCDCINMMITKAEQDQQNNLALLSILLSFKGSILDQDTQTLAYFVNQYTELRLQQINKTSSQVR